MTVEAGINSILSSSALTTLTSTRIYPIVMPQDCDLPSVTFQRISDIPDYVLGGTVGIQASRVQINSFSYTLKQALEVAAAVKSALVGVSGSYGNVTFKDITAENENDLYEPDTAIYQVIQDFLVYYY